MRIFDERNLASSFKQIRAPKLDYGFGFEPLGDQQSHRNILGDYYLDKLIMTMSLSFNLDTVREARQLKDMARSENRYLLPKQVAYADYINTGFDELMRKQK